MDAGKQSSGNSQDDLLIDANYAALILKRFKVFYADQYHQRYLNHLDRDVASEILFALHDVKVKQVALGMIEMRKRKFMPNFAEFRELCLGASWLSVERAWLMVVNYDAGVSSEVSVQALEAYSEVRLLLEGQGQKVAFRAFREVYQSKIDFCQSQGIDQEIKKMPRLGFGGGNDDDNRLSATEQRELNQSMLSQIALKIGKSFKSV